MFQCFLGRYNFGFISFKYDDVGMDCLEWWKECCFEECKNVLGEGKFGDQGYLDYMFELFLNVCDIMIFGVNIGYWNYGQYMFFWEDDWIVLEDGSLLIFYYFSGY